MGTLNYQNSGVNRDRADELVQSITGMVKSTLNKNVASSVGGYASIYKLSPKQWIAASTDGVGTKLKLAFDWNMHDQVGQDLVAMSVNDLICVGSRPLFFLDYFATGKLDNGIAKRVIHGVAAGCKLAGCALVGGETAEMPGFYDEGEYDLAGFAVGSVDPKKILPSAKIKAGDVLIGVESSGFHSNGYSLVRKLIAEMIASGTEVTETMKQAFLKPTHIYAKAVLPLIEKKLIKGAAHITGSGFLNVPRMSTKVDYSITLPSLGERASVYSWLHDLNRVDFEEQCQTYNMGIGMVLVVDKKNVKKIIVSLKKSRFKAWTLGETTKRKSKTNCLVSVSSAEGQCQLKY